jgi:hypothetical protein
MLASTFLRPGSRQFRLTVLFRGSEFHVVIVFSPETAALADNLLEVDSEPESNKRERNYLESRQSGRTSFDVQNRISEILTSVRSRAII